MIGRVTSYGGEVDPAVHVGRWRLRIIGGAFVLAFLSIAIRLVHMMPPSPAIPAAEAMPAPDADGPVTAAHARPDITDRDGVILATDLLMPSVYGDPSLMPDPAQAARQLSHVLSGVDALELARRFAASRRFAWVKHQITPKEQEAVLELGIPGVGFRMAEHRVYPNGRLASHVLGFVDIDNHGLAGMEYALDRGTLGDHRAGQPVTLSLDLRIEEAVTSELRQAVLRFHPKGACSLVLDRVTGEVLALASLPDFDPNQADQAPADQRENRCTGGTYELGSLFKIVSHAMALDSGKVRLGDRFDATQPLQIGRFRIRDDHAKRRWLSVPEIFMYSSNIGTARMAFAAGGADALKGFLRRVGLLERDPLEIPEVADPQLPRRWADVTTATVSFGHGIAVTPFHYLDVVGGLVGDGTRIPPTLLARSPDDLPQRERLISAKTAQDLRFLLWLTVENGTGTKAQVAGYMVGGKTGTADKAVHGGYSHDAVLASFVGVFPLEAPRYLVLVMLDQPTGDAETHGFRYGGWTAAPVVGEIIDRIGPLLDIHRSPPAAVEAMRARMVAAKLTGEASGLEKPGAAVVARD